MTIRDSESFLIKPVNAGFSLIHTPAGDYAPCRGVGRSPSPDYFFLTCPSAIISTALAIRRSRVSRFLASSIHETNSFLWL